MNQRAGLFLLFAAWMVVPLVPVFASAPFPETVPTCSAPQLIAPMQPVAAGSSLVATNPVVWNGKDFATAWEDTTTQKVYFRRLYADGTPAAPAVLIGSGYNAYTKVVDLVWNGSGYGIAWENLGAGGVYQEAYFALLDVNGTMTSGPTKVSFVGATETAGVWGLALAWSGSDYAVVWSDARNAGTGFDVFGTLLTAAGAVAGAGAYHDIVLCNQPNAQQNPAVAWSSANGTFFAVWDDYRSGTRYQIYGTRLYPSNGTTYVLNGGSSISAGASNSDMPALADTGGGTGVAWYDNRDANYEIYLARIDYNGMKVGSDLRVTNDIASSFAPSLVWTGGEYGLFWEDNRAGNYDTWFQRISSAGALVGGNLQVSSTTGLLQPSAAFSGLDYMTTGHFDFSLAEAQPWGCSYLYSPPCPENAFAYAITGTSATISWLPAVDPYHTIAYYQVYRNNALVGITDNSYFTDTGLALSTTYNYAIRTVNAAQLVSTGCPATSSVYVKTNATLLLMVNKNSPNAALSWTDSSQPLNNYNVFRGTSPQVMQRIGTAAGSSFSDPNVLNDNILYFYTVDDPGQ